MANLKPCQACCPKRPGYPVGRVSHEWDNEEINGAWVWGWRCENCGHFKRPRAKQQRIDYDFVTRQAESDKGLSLVNGVRFHCFNPNGLVAKLNAVQERVGQVVDETGVPNGVLFVHGSLNSFQRDSMFKLLDKKAPGRIAYQVNVAGLRRDIERAEAWIAETLAKFEAA